jgi:hypothetical protein
VPGGEEVVRAAAADVEAERAAVLAAVDGVAAAELAAEDARHVVDADGAAELLGRRGDLDELGTGDRAVNGQDDLVGGRVDRPRGAGHLGRALERGRGLLKLGPAERDGLRYGAGGAYGVGIGLGGDGDDEFVRGVVQIGAGGAGSQLTGELGGQL